MSSRVHPHSPLPAPALHATYPSAQSKSHVLAGVQDAYWSDDEAEDAECPLCLEEMDISDLNFKPCPCGYQICRFCWHHIKENLNRRCPACRREYTDETVQFKPINKEDHKRLTQQKKQRERERKELDALGRRHLANVRVVQRNVVYVVGMGPRFAKEELIPTLRSSEYFGQYGKISKIVIVKRTPSGGRAPVVGLYITYHRREDAARAIAAVDGAPSPGGGHEIMRASHGTTKYCMAFLRGVTCTDHGCMNLHEWGDEKDCFTKEDLTTLKHTMKDTETRSRTTTTVRKADEADGLPRAASWANKAPTTLVSSTLHNNATVSSSSTARQPRRGTGTRQQRSGSTPTTTAEPRSNGKDRRGAQAGKAPSQASSSRPATPSHNRPATPSAGKVPKLKEPSPPPVPARSPTPSATAESDSGSAGQDTTLVASPECTPPPKIPSAPPGLPTVPPGLSAPPGLPPPSSRTTSAMASPLQISSAQSSYQMSSQAQALMEDLKARREMPQVLTERSPFPDFDRMLQTLSGGDGDGGFSFNLDPALAGEAADAPLNLPELEIDASTPFHGTFLDTFPALRHNPAASPLMGPPGIPYPPRTLYDSLGMRQPTIERQSTGSSGYTGSFNPFADSNEESQSKRFSPLDEERQVSRFGFARGRQGSSSSSVHPASPLSNVDNVPHMPFYNSSEHNSPVTRTPPQWTYQARQPLHGFAHHDGGSAMSSPLARHAQAQSLYQQQQPQLSSQFQPFDSGVSEAQLRELITSSRTNHMRNGLSDQASYPVNPTQPFNDPAIMSASFSPSHVGYGPPPGLSMTNGPVTNSPSLVNHHAYGLANRTVANLEVAQTNGQVSTSPSLEPSVAPSPALSSSDFPALSAAVELRREQPHSGPTSSAGTPDVDSAAQTKADRKAAKLAERQRIAQEKAATKAAEKERRAAEKEKAAALKVEKDRLAKEKVEEERIERERVEKQRAEIERVEREHAYKERVEREQAAKEKAEQERAAKERLEQEKTEKQAQAKKAAAAKAAASQPPKQSDGEESAQSENLPKHTQAAKQTPAGSPKLAIQVPILSKMPKKSKPVTKPIKIPKEDVISESASALPSATNSEAPPFPDGRGTESSSNNSRAQSVDHSLISQTTSVERMLEDLDCEFPHLHISEHPFFDLQKINPAAKMPLEYGPLVHALSALSVGGGSFANNMPSGSIDHAVSSFQQLLETLTQTISDLLRLLPRKTWDDNSSFDGVLRDMLKGDDFLDEGEDQNGQVKEDEVAALTLALERRARWMEVQLSKLEELHRDINIAAVRAVLAFNDNGWDYYQSLPRVGNTLARFDILGIINENDEARPMTADELEEKLLKAKDAAAFAEAELRESMQRLQVMKPAHLEE